MKSGSPHVLSVITDRCSSVWSSLDLPSHLQRPSLVPKTAFQHSTGVQRSSISVRTPEEYCKGKPDLTFLDYLRESIRRVHKESAVPPWQGEVKGHRVFCLLVPLDITRKPSVISREVLKMSIAKAAAKAMLSDALLQDGPGIHRLNHLELELPLDKVIKFVSVGLPLLLVCMAFAREISLGEDLSLSIPFLLFVFFHTR